MSEIRRSWTTIQMSRATHARIKAEAQRSGRQVLEVVEHGMRLYLASVEPKTPTDDLLARGAAYAREAAR